MVDVRRINVPDRSFARDQQIERRRMVVQNPGAEDHVDGADLFQNRGMARVA